MSEPLFLSQNWQFIESSRAESDRWLAAEIPGHVHLDLWKNGIIGDPFFRMQEMGSRWVDETDWTYRCQFEVDLDPDACRRTIRFEGLDSICSIWLNGKQIGASDNMFVPIELDITEHLANGANELKIEFSSASKVGQERRAAYFAKEGIKDDTANFDSRAFVRKAQYMYGWDWGPTLISCGVWKPVSIRQYSHRIQEVWVRQIHDESGAVELQIESLHEGEGMPTHFVYGPDGELVAGLEGDGSVHLINPSLWWTHDLGGQPLYTVETMLIFEGMPVDRHETRVGIRRLALLRVPDSFGESFEFELNGRKLWARGANWIPDHSFPSAVTPNNLRERFSAMVDMSMNMIRVWGGGLYESDEFYEMADERGILIWQDFAYACSYYPDDAAAQSVARVEAEANIRRLRNHPSLAIWCGNNENLTMWHSGWGGRDRQPARYEGERIYDQVLPEVVQTLDPGRPYIPTSPCGGEDPNSGGVGDQHYWDVWHGRGDWRHYADSTARFSSEFGFAASPSMEVWERFTAPEDRSPESAVVQWHDKTRKGCDTYLGFIHLHYPKIRTLQDLAYFSQLNQRDALRFGIEHYRRSAFCKGSLIWQLNDCWPVQSWAVVDCLGNYKAAAFELRRLYQERLVSIQREKAEVSVWAVNDGDVTEEASFSLAAISLKTGEPVEVWEEVAEVKPGERKVVLSATLSSHAAPETILVADWSDEDTTWQFISEPKDARFVPAELIASCSDSDGESLILKTTAPVVDLFLWDPDCGCKLEDNFVTLMSPGRAWVRFKGSVPSRLLGRSLSGLHEIPVVRSPL